MTGLIDTHCHLNLNQFDEDLDEVMVRALASGVTNIVTPGVDLASSLRAVQLAEKYPQIYAAVGVHPNEAANWSEDDLGAFEKLAQHPKVVAIGEIGLDYYRDRVNHDQQKKVLLAQLKLAKELNKPVIVHNRAAFTDLWPILQTWQNHLANQQHALANRPGVMHSFDGELPQAETVRESHFFLGISGPVTFTNAKERQQLIQLLGLENVILETDAPYLAPHPFRGRRNEPAYVKLIAEKISSLQNCSLETVAAATTRNARILFMEIV